MDKPKDTIMQSRSKLILDLLAEGLTFQEIRDRYGFDSEDLVRAAKFGVAELGEEYQRLLDARKDARNGNRKH